VPRAAELDRASGTHPGVDVTGIAPEGGSALVNRHAKHPKRSVPERAAKAIRGLSSKWIR
jgi:hypothetical protein